VPASSSLNCIVLGVYNRLSLYILITISPTAVSQLIYSTQFYYTALL